MPSSMFMQELVLSHPEFLVLLDAVQARLVVGMDPTSLFPLDEGERHAVLEEGKAALQRRGGLQEQGQFTYQLTPAFQALAQTIAYPQVAIITVRDVTGIGPQLFLHYTARGQFVEQTFPREHVHRLAVLPDLPTFIERERFILSLEEISAPDTLLEMSEDTLRSVKDLVQYQPPERAEAFFTRYGANASEAVILYQAFAHPTFTGSVAILRCNQEKVTDARSVFVLQGAGSAWRATQKVPGGPLLSIQATNASDIKHQLLQYFEALSRAV